MRKGCGPLRALPLMKIPELVELVGLASLVSYRIWPDTVHLSFPVMCDSQKMNCVGCRGATLRSTWTGRRTLGQFCMDPISAQKDTKANGEFKSFAETLGD